MASNEIRAPLLGVVYWATVNGLSGFQGELRAGCEEVDEDSKEKMKEMDGRQIKEKLEDQSTKVH